MKPERTILFMGTAAFAVPTLDRLLSAGYNVPAVVTAPDRPAGRGKRIRQSPIKEYATSKGLSVLQPEKLRDENFINQLQTFRPDLQVVVAFRMLPEQVWGFPPLGTINLHASLLPQYRGAAPINHVLFNGEKKTGVTTFYIDEKIDTGEILGQQAIAIGPEETAGELHDRLKELGANLVLDTVEDILNAKARGKQQDKYVFSDLPLKRAPKLQKEDLQIDWTRSIDAVFNRIRGLSPVPGAYTRLIDKDGSLKVLKIYRTEKTNKTEKTEPGSVKFTKNSMEVACIDGTLSLKEVQIEGKKKMEIRDFLRGIQPKNIVRAG